MTDDKQGEPKKLEIKKYANRRYYDATHSRHLTLEEIRSLIQQGYDIRVLDAKTSDDITAQVLTQIILEFDTPKLDSLPVPLLVRIIRMNDQLVKDFIEKYFNQALKSFLDYQQRLEEQFRRAHGLPSVFPSMAAWTKAMLQPFSTAFGKAQPEPATESDTADASPSKEPVVQGSNSKKRKKSPPRRRSSVKRKK
jgi:polyhydroxyalkanoate synthesis repressor PhaR